MLSKHPSIGEAAAGKYGDEGATYQLKTDCPKGAAFLNELDLWVLHAMALDSWEVFGPLMKGSRAVAMPYKPAKDLFDQLYRTRYYVMHVQPLDTEAFLGARERLLRAHGMLGVNLERAIDRIGEREKQITEWVARQYGYAMDRPASSAPLRPDNTA